MNPEQPKLQIYTDGACKGNPGPGGWGVVIKYGNHEKELCGGSPHTTNNQMELTAAIKALEALKRPVDGTIYTDSKYVLNGATKWMFTWKNNGWTKEGGIKNVDLWVKLYDLLKPHSLKWVWVKGHSGFPGNERADELANMKVPKVKR